jgi:hypothetical protein
MERIEKFGPVQPDFTPDPLDLYRAFPPADFERLAALHAYFSARQFQVLIKIQNGSAWTVQYQDPRQTTAAPLFQVEYQVSSRPPLTLYIRLASTDQIAALIPNQSQTLQDDFFQRVKRCRGPKCSLCKNNQSLAPTALERNGLPVVLCWEISPEISVDENTVALIEEYAEMQAALGIA